MTVWKQGATLPASNITIAGFSLENRARPDNPVGKLVKFGECACSNIDAEQERRSERPPRREHGLAVGALRANGEETRRIGCPLILVEDLRSIRLGTVFDNEAPVDAGALV